MQSLQNIVLALPPKIVLLDQKPQIKPQIKLLLFIVCLNQK